MNSPQNTWFVLGAGAIGCLWAVRLQSAGLPVKLILSERRKLSLGNPHSMSIRYSAGPNASAEVFKFQVANEYDRIERLLLATKANDALNAIRGVTQQLSADAVVASLSNGMGYHEALAESVQNGAAYAITTTDGAYFDPASLASRSKKMSLPRLILAGRGKSKIGRINASDQTNEKWRQQLKAVAAELSTRGNKVLPRINTQRLLLDKLLVNACINGLTAIHGCSNGGLLKDKEASKRLNSLLEECVAIAIAAGHGSLARNLSNRVYEVIHATESNYSSTYTDIKLGRESEVNFINAYLVSLGASLGVSTQFNQAIVDTIAQLEH